eukprot:5999616-Pyramimonas_sp.AAC.1
MQELHTLRAVPFQNVAFALAPRAFVFLVQELNILRAVRFQHVALALAPRTFVCKYCKSFADVHDQRTRHGVLEGLRVMRVNSHVDLRCRNP